MSADLRMASDSHTVWLITTEDGEKFIDVTVSTLPVENVASMFQRMVLGVDIRRQEFSIRNITVGGFFWLDSKCECTHLQSYSNDARSYYSTGEVKL